MYGLSWRLSLLVAAVSGFLIPVARGQSTWEDKLRGTPRPLLEDHVAVGSHASIPVDPNSLELLKKQMQNAPGMRKLLDMMNSGTGTDGKSLRDELKKLLPKDFKLNDELRKSLEQQLGQPRGRILPMLKPETLPRNSEQLLDLLKKFSPSATTTLANKIITETLKRQQTTEPQPSADAPTRLPDRAASAAEQEPEQQSFDEKINEWLLRQAERLNDSNNPLLRSPAIQEALRTLRESVLDEANGRASTALKDSYLGRELLRLGKSLHAERLLNDFDLPAAANKLAPSPFGRFHLPRFGMRWGAMPAVGMPDLGSGSGSSSETGSAVLVLLGMVAAGQLIWLTWLHRRKARAGQQATAPAWPAMPTAIATREDVIRAFESLSLRRLGPESRSWNHLVIAGELGGEVAMRRQAADHLAALYEQARYAPGYESLPDEALAAASRDVSLLAEAAAL